MNKTTSNILTTLGQSRISIVEGNELRIKHCYLFWHPEADGTVLPSHEILEYPHPKAC